MQREDLSWLTEYIHAYVPTLQFPLVSDLDQYLYARIPQSQDTAESLLREVVEGLSRPLDIFLRIALLEKVEKFLNDQSK